MFAGALVLRVGWTLTIGRQAVCDRYEVFVILRIGVASIPDEDALQVNGKLEGFVLGTLSDTIRRL